MSWPCMPVRGHAARHRPPSPPNRPSSSASWKSASLPQRTCSAFRGQRRSCTICTAILRSKLRVCACRAPRRPSGKSCGKQAVSKTDRRHKPKPLELRKPGEEVQFDLKDASSVPPDPEGTKQHVVEIANFVDAGTSIWLHREVGSDFDAETLLEVVAQFLREHGRPAMLTFDNDPRFVGSPSGRDFPSALLRFLLCLGVEPNVIPPHRPDKNPYVERFHRTLSQEWGPRASAWHPQAGPGDHRGLFDPLQ